MANKFVLVLLAFALHHGVLAAPKPKAASSPVAPPAESTANAGTVLINLFKDINAEIQKHIPDPKKVVDDATKTSHELVTNLEGIITKWRTEADKNKGEFSAAAEGVFAKLSEAVSDLNKLATPPQGTKASEYKAKFDENVKELTTFGNKLKDDVKPFFDKVEKDVTSLGSWFFDGVWNFGKTVQSHVEGLAKPDAPH